MIRNAVIHISNEQPLLADLYQMPTTADVSLVCTNVRNLDGKKPVFVEHSLSVFVFPYLHVRFIEIMADTATGLPTASGDGVVALTGPDSNGETDADADADADGDLELDEDFLRRIREV